MAANIDYSSPAAQFTYDVNKSNTFKKDKRNFINVLGIKQLNTLDNVSLLDIFLSANNVIEPHYHQNASELVYCISGSAVVSIFNPFTKQLQNYPIRPGQVANVPHGWWHYEVADENETHLLAIFNASEPEVILGSDLLKFTPADIMAKTYCMDENQWKKTIAPVQPNTFIGPAKNCAGRHDYGNYSRYHNQQYYQNPPMHPYEPYNYPR
ncbi:cupin domain-containing protein [Peribacillus sp. B-H-3]|uniref:cupin domain-containing protein n=1 Tax=Peribacillus sp. B-H-3 TaxID=3400420 RepID=UPI003B0181BE